LEFFRGLPSNHNPTEQRPPAIRRPQDKKVAATKSEQAVEKNYLDFAGPGVDGLALMGGL
jgi:hypothetical protein